MATTLRARPDCRWPRRRPRASAALVELGGRTVGVFRLDGGYFALADRCPHRGAPLCSSGEVVNAVEGMGDAARVTREGALVRCPWHKWDFEIATGRCPSTAPAGAALPRAGRGEELVVSLDAVPAADDAHRSLAQTEQHELREFVQCRRAASLGVPGEREDALAEDVVECQRHEAARGSTIRRGTMRRPRRPRRASARCRCRRSA